MTGFLRFFKRKTKESWSIVSKERAFAPHCDQTVLHAPGVCEYCDHYPDWQEYREVSRINFTQQSEPDKAPCPSEHFRPAEVRDLWGGNVPNGSWFPADFDD